MTGERDSGVDELGQATALYDAGHAGEALQVLDGAIGRLEATEDQLRPFLMLQKAGWLRETGHLEDAVQALNEVEAELTRLPAVGHEAEQSNLLMEKALVERQRGEFDHADDLFAEAEVVGRRSSASELVVPDVLANRAGLCLERDRLSQAQDLLLAALEIDQRVGNDRSQANDLNMLGLVYQRLGDRDTAQAYFIRSLDLAQQQHVARLAAEAASNLASLMDLAGDHESAAELFRDLGSFWSDGGDPANAACSLANQGVAAALAKQYEHAADLFQRAHTLHLETENWLHAVQDQLNLSQLERERGDAPAALTHAEAAVGAARSRGLYGLLAQLEYLTALCRMDIARSSGDATGIASFEQALDGLLRAIDVVELLRLNVDRPEERKSLLTDYEAIYEEAIGLSMAMQRVKQAFGLCERARARSFLEALGSQRAQLDRATPEGARRLELVDRLVDPKIPPDDKPEMLNELRTLRAEAIARAPAVAAITESELPTIDDICAAIPSETAMLVLFHLGQSILLFLLDTTGARDCVLQKLTDPVAEVVERFRREIDDSNTELATGNFLFAALLRPVMPLLAKTPSLMVVPHKSLHYLPFSALWFEPAGDDSALWVRPAGDDGPPREYLKNRFRLATLPSASYLPLAAGPGSADASLTAALVLGNPTGDLAGAEREAQLVAAKLGVPALTGQQATREMVLTAERPVVVHIASHGNYNPQDPLLSGVQLADALLTVEDLLSAGPGPRLLVLSGCFTGISEYRPGDELTGLGQAALINGTRAVIVSLWETSDDSSALFFDYFYDAMTAGATVGEAIGYGQHLVSQTPDGYDQPLDWAPFVLLGDPTTLLTPGEPLNATSQDPPGTRSE